MEFCRQNDNVIIKNKKTIVERSSSTVIKHQCWQHLLAVKHYVYHIIHKLKTPKVFCMFMDSSTSYFARDNGHCLCMSSLIRYRYSLIRYRLVQPISLVNQSKFSCKRQCRCRIRKLYSHSSEKLCNTPILHHLHRTKANKQVTTFTVLAGKRSHLITCLSL